MLGLVPDCAPAQVTAAGNAAGTGARIALLNRASRAEIEDVVRNVEKIETAVEPRFQEHFVHAMAIPHDIDPYPRLAAVVALPPRRTSQTQTRPRRRRSVATRERSQHDRDQRPSHRRSRRASSGTPECRRRARAVHHPHADPVRSALREGLELIEHNADTILEQVGIDFRDAPDALELLRGAARRSRASASRFPRRLARQLVQATAPERFTQVARNPARSVELGGLNTVLAPAYGSPFVRDLDGGRRYGTIEDFRNFVKLAYVSPWLHHSGGTVCEPVDLPVNKRHYDMVYAHLRYSDKPFMGSVTHPTRAEDTVEMARIVFGADFLEQNTVILSLANANSPLVWDSTMLGAARAYAEANQAVLITPFILAGAMSPATAAGAATPDARRGPGGNGVLPARATGRPGRARLVRVLDVDADWRSDVRHAGAGDDAVRDGRAGAPTPCPVPLGRRAHRLEGRRRPGRLRVRPTRCSPEMLGGVGLRAPRSRAGFEGGLTMGYEKFMLDVDQCGAWHEFCKGLDMTENGQALDAILTNGPGTAFPRPPAHARQFRDCVLPLAARRQCELRAVGGRGRQGRGERANVAWKKALEQYQAPHLDEAVDEELREWIERKKASFADAFV